MVFLLRDWVCSPCLPRCVTVSAQVRVGHLCIAHWLTLWSTVLRRHTEHRLVSLLHSHTGLSSGEFFCEEWSWGTWDTQVVAELHFLLPISLYCFCHLYGPLPETHPMFHRSHHNATSPSQWGRPHCKIPSKLSLYPKPG